MRKLIVVAVLVSFLIPRVSFALETNQSEPAVAPLNEGQPAPFSGVIFNKPAAAKLIIELKHETIGTQLEVDRAVSDAIAKKDKEALDATATCTREKTEKDIKNSTLEETLKLKQKEIDVLKIQLENAPNAMTWFGIGTISGVVFTIVTAFAIGQVAK